MVDVIAKQALPSLENLLTALSAPAELVKDSHPAFPIMQEVQSSISAYSDVLERIRSLHVQMLAVVKEHGEKTNKTVSEPFTQHVTQVSKIIHIIEGFLKHIEAETTKETRLQRKLLQERETALSEKRKAYLEANICPSKDPGFQQTLEALDNVQTQKQELGQQEKDLSLLLSKLAASKMQLNELENEGNAIQPIKKRRFSWWGS